MRAATYASRTLGVALGTLMALGFASTAVADDAAQSSPHQEQPTVSLAASMWTVQSTPQAIEVRTTYSESTPPQEYVGKAVDIQRMGPDGSWETVGTAQQEKVDDAPKTTATVEFSFATSGRMWLRARSHPSSGTVTSSQQLVDVRDEPPRFNPTALPGSNDCISSSISNPRTIVYSCGQAGDRLYAVAHDHQTGKQTKLTDQEVLYPIVADDAPIATVERAATPQRALRIDLRNDQVEPLAYDRSGKAVKESDALSISDNGKLTLYASAERGIVKNAPKGTNIYLKRQGRERSTLIGRGRHAQISGNGTFIVWRTPTNVLRRTNLANGRTITLRGTRLTGMDAGPSISRNGRYVAYAQPGKDRNRRVYVRDIRKGTTLSAGRGSVPRLSPDGKHVAFSSRANSELFVWSRTTKRRVLVSVGLSGSGADLNFVESPDFSADSRWLVADVDSALVAPDNGRNEYDGWNDMVLFDLTELEEGK